jgi:hypothetical protein
MYGDINPYVGIIFLSNGKSTDLQVVIRLKVNSCSGKDEIQSEKGHQLRENIPPLICPVELTMSSGRTRLEPVSSRTALSLTDLAYLETKETGHYQDA